MINDSKMEPLLDIKQAAELIGMSVHWLYRATARGEVPVVKMGSGPKSKLRFRPEKLKEWVEERSRG
jgi:excisionase family DNA binding protein